MSAAKEEARAVRVQITDAIAEMPLAHRKAVQAIAQKLREDVAEGGTQEQGLGLMALGLVGSEVAEQQA